MLSRRSAFLAFLLPITAFRDFPSICTWDPPIEAIAGEILSARIVNPQARRCEASLSFDDPAFLPIRYTFDILECEGLQLAEFTIPPTVPNGDAFALWQCSGTESTSCAHVAIMNGTGTLDIYEGHGTVGCITERRQSTTALVTSTSSGVPVTLTLPTVTTITETSFALAINVSDVQPTGTDQALPTSVMAPDTATITDTATVPGSATVSETAVGPDTAAIPGTALPPNTAATNTAATDTATTNTAATDTATTNTAATDTATTNTAAADTATTNTAAADTAATNTALTTTATFTGTGQVADTTHWTTTSRRSNVVATLSDDSNSDPLTTNTSVAPAVVATGNGSGQGTESTNSGGGATAPTKSDPKSSATALAATDGTGGTQFLSNADGFQIGTTSSRAPITKPPTMAAAITTLTIMVTSIMKEACTTQTSA